MGRVTDGKLRILRVFVRMTTYTPVDDLTVVGEPELFTPRDIDEIHISCVFSWDRETASRLKPIWENWSQDWAASAPVRIGGPAFPSRRRTTFHPGRYVRPGITFTSRGCDFKCPWCMVDQIEGPFRKLAHVAPGNIIQDNNLLLANRSHIWKIFDMLKAQKRIKFCGGLDSRLLKPWHVAELRGLAVRELWFALDDQRRMRSFERTARLVKDFPRNTKRCYMLAGFGNDTIEKAEARTKRVWDLGFIPFVQLYQPAEGKEYSRDWLLWRRTRIRPAIMAASWGRR